MADRDALLALADRVDGGKGCDNALDVLIEVAMFKAGSVYTAVRSNNAGTKVVYTDKAGNRVTCWAEEWTADRQSVSAALRALAGGQG